MNDIINKIKARAALLPERWCSRCKRNRKLWAEENMCAECADDVIQLETGCRFGESSCSHHDCKHAMN